MAGRVGTAREEPLHPGAGRGPRDYLHRRDRFHVWLAVRGRGRRDPPDQNGIPRPDAGRVECQRGPVGARSDERPLGTRPRHPPALREAHLHPPPRRRRADADDRPPPRRHAPHPVGRRLQTPRRPDRRLLRLRPLRRRPRGPHGTPPQVPGSQAVRSRRHQDRRRPRLPHPLHPVPQLRLLPHATLHRRRRRPSRRRPLPQLRRPPHVPLRRPSDPAQGSRGLLRRL
mmetsp:Transcript_9929/g.25232  ORF Transcript_9929/g.25232 Transcript_9929/m.25232 type:complete len:228 (-) Transcript_9929:509-1192(-)